MKISELTSHPLWRLSYSTHSLAYAIRSKRQDSFTSLQISYETTPDGEKRLLSEHERVLMAAANQIRWQINPVYSAVSDVIGKILSDLEFEFLCPGCSDPVTPGELICHCGQNLYRYNEFLAHEHRRMTPSVDQITHNFNSIIEKCDIEVTATEVPFVDDFGSACEFMVNSHLFVTDSVREHVYVVGKAMALPGADLKVLRSKVGITSTRANGYLAASQCSETMQGRLANKDISLSGLNLIFKQPKPFRDAMLHYIEDNCYRMTPVTQIKQIIARAQERIPDNLDHLEQNRGEGLYHYNTRLLQRAQTKQFYLDNIDGFWSAVFRADVDLNLQPSVWPEELSCVTCALREPLKELPIIEGLVYPCQLDDTQGGCLYHSATGVILADHRVTGDLLLDKDYFSSIQLAKEAYLGLECAHDRQFYIDHKRVILGNQKRVIALRQAYSTGRASTRCESCQHKNPPAETGCFCIVSDTSMRIARWNTSVLRCGNFIPQRPLYQKLYNTQICDSMVSLLLEEALEFMIDESENDPFDYIGPLSPFLLSFGCTASGPTADARYILQLLKSDQLNIGQQAFILIHMAEMRDLVHQRFGLSYLD